jgi:hypothetical protein
MRKGSPETAGFWRGVGCPQAHLTLPSSRRRGKERLLQLLREVIFKVILCPAFKCQWAQGKWLCELGDTTNPAKGSWICWACDFFDRFYSFILVLYPFSNTSTEHVTNTVVIFYLAAQLFPFFKHNHPCYYNHKSRELLHLINTKYFIYDRKAIYATLAARECHYSDGNEDAR